MKLPQIITNFFQPKTAKQEYFLSLLLDSDHIQLAAWTMQNRTAILKSAVSNLTEKDTWEKRAEAVDEALVAIEEKLDTTGLKKVVFGLPSEYLTQDDNIEKSIRSEIKKLSLALELEALGFVSTTQALIYKLKRDEGIPPSVIFIGVTEKNLALSLYKIGNQIGRATVKRDRQSTQAIESFLKSLKDIEVLPSRMLIYGTSLKLNDEVKSELLRFPWPTKVNFLHFPKIEILPKDEPVTAVSLAGAKEMASELGSDSDDESQPAFASEKKPGKEESYKSEDDELTMDKDHETEVTDEDQVPDDDFVVQAEEADGQTENESFESQKETEEDEASNVTLVNPEVLGFKQDIDILDKVQEENKEEKQAKRQIRLPSLKLSNFSYLKEKFNKLNGGKTIFVLGFIIIILLVYFGYQWFIPKATITILAIPKVINEQQQVIVNPTATVVDTFSRTIPGVKQEKISQGETTIPVTGKKKVGDSAKGTVTIYNKSLSAKKFTKETIFQSGALSFSLDSDVLVASASESLSQGTTTYGKAEGSVTAMEIGAQSNLPTGSQFNLKGISESIATARNDQAFTGGASKEVTVVTRVDLDALVKSLSQDLVQKAKQDLAGSVGGNEKLIDETIKTNVTEKTFTEELDQEAQILHGKLTMSITGVTYKDDDIKLFVYQALQDKLPQGYALTSDQIAVEIRNAQVKKDATITMTADFKATTMPSLDTGEIKQKLAGKNIDSAREILEKINGIGGVEIAFYLSPGKNRLPLNKNNISISIASIQK